MKQFFTLVVALICFATQAQQVSLPTHQNAKKITADRKTSIKAGKHGAGRANTSDLIIAYGLNEGLWADANGLTASATLWPVNSSVPQDSITFYSDVTVFFDSIVENTDEFNSFVIKTYPKAQSTLTVNAVTTYANYVNTQLTNDTFIYTVYKLPVGWKYSTAVATPTFGGLTDGAAVDKWATGPLVVYSDTFVSNGKDISGFAVDSFVSGSLTIYLLECRPNITLAKGETFGARLEMKAPVLNQLNAIADYSDSCTLTAPAGTEPIFAINAKYPNSTGFLNWKINNTTNYSGVYRNDLFFNGPTSCNRLYTQNWRMLADVSNTIDFGAEIAAAKTSGCPNSPIDVSANAYGSGAFTYDWSVTPGASLSSTTDELVTVTMPATGDATVTLITTDSLGTSKDTSTLVLKNNVINVAINGGAPVSIACGTTATVQTVNTGVIAGTKIYEWNIDADAQLDTTVTSAAVGKMGNLLPGNYSVTVTNSIGCTGSTNFSVVYNNGTTNNVNFSVEDVVAGGATQVCINRPTTFTNTSSHQGSGWGASWTFGDAALSSSTDISPIFTYVASGNAVVTLTMDSAGCVFTGPSKTVQVLNAQATQCRYGVGINEASFEQNVTLSPNPTSGTVNLNVSGAEKNVRVSIVNVIGSEVYNFNSTDVTATFNKQIDLSSLSNGTYLVKVQSAGRTAVKRLIIAK